MSVSADQKTAIVGWYRTLNRVNYRFECVKLAGLLPDVLYENSRSAVRCYGDELMSYGLIRTAPRENRLRKTDCRWILSRAFMC